MDQIPAFYDDQFQAVRTAIEGGVGYKKTAMHIWPGMKPESAYARLKNCVSGTSDQKLDMGEVLAVCQFNGRYDPLYWLCDETMHARPIQRNAKDVAKTLAASIQESVELQGKQMARLESLLAQNPTLLKQVA